MQGEKEISLTETLERAIALHEAGDFSGAERLYEAILRAKPAAFGARHYEALHYLAVREARQGRQQEAYRLISHALKVNPRDAKAHSNCGNILQGLERYEEALDSYEKALAIDPGDAMSWNNRGVALYELKRHEAALASYEKALLLKPDYAEAHNNRGNALLELERHEEALASFGRALALEPGYAKAHNNRGNALLELKRHEEALASFGRALALEPDSPDFFWNRGNALAMLGKHDEAINDYTRVLDLAPGYPRAIGALVNARMHCCHWHRHSEETQRIVSDVRAGKNSIEPFMFLSISDSAQDQLSCARIAVHKEYPASRSALWAGARARHDRIRVAYLSADFHEHATAYLMAGLFEQHDRERFDITAVSFAPDIPSEMRSRLKGAFERFIDARQKSDREVANLLREMEIDIAVDLKGFTLDKRTGIFALRPAPIQVNYLGYPGTMGADYIDYILADRVVIPNEHHACYTEKVVYLPDTYQVNDSKRQIAERAPTRPEAGLPEQGFVFCSFNNTYKITPTIFDVWMRLLRDVGGSVLWLLESSAAAARNLRREAAERGIAPERLVIASRVQYKDHLARHRLADLFLDTLPCNAHTTASDALWAALPVLTCLGTTFAGRVAASLLNAAGLPELITRTMEEYEALALKLAKDGKMLAEIKAKLARNRETCPLFDTDRFRRHIEAAYATMWERHQRREPPASFAVEPHA